jgi:UDP-2-acetamido-3-amino-2,3-dideoxy-glucuronate N-acetyltransferase
MQDAFEPFFEDHRAETAYIHESSYVDTPCHIGEHTSILHFSHVMANSIIGDHCLIGRNVTIASGVFLGNNVRVMNNTQLNSGVILENEVYCGPSTIFADPRHIRANTRSISRVSPTLVRRGAQIGPNSTIAAGFTIGSFAFIEAGTVVDRNVPDFAVVYGNPLKFAGWRCECGQMIPLGATDQNLSRSLEKSLERDLEKEAQCSGCGKAYLRQSKWKVLQLASRLNHEGIDGLDTYSEFDPTSRTVERSD